MFEWFADLVVYQWLKLPPEQHFSKALHFFVYDAPKILVLLAVAIFVITIIRSYFPPHKTKKYLSHKRTIFGNVLAALIGIMTPFCSCSAVPLFIGFIEAGVPLGVTFSFLISSPMINEIALVLLWGMFGWKVALLYMASGLVIAIIGLITFNGLHNRMRLVVHQMETLRTMLVNRLEGLEQHELGASSAKPVYYAAQEA